jgi:hypothetical protein
MDGERVFLSISLIGGRLKDNQFGWRHWGFVLVRGVFSFFEYAFMLESNAQGMAFGSIRCEGDSPRRFSLGHRFVGQQHRDFPILTF